MWILFIASILVGVFCKSSWNQRYYDSHYSSRSTFSSNSEEFNVTYKNVFGNNVNTMSIRNYNNRTTLLVSIRNFNSEEKPKGQLFYEIDTETGKLIEYAKYTSNHLAMSGSNPLTSDNKKIVSNGILTDSTCIFTVNLEEKAVDWTYDIMDHYEHSFYTSISEKDVVIYQVSVGKFDPDFFTAGIKVGEKELTWGIHTDYEFFYVIDDEDNLWGLDGDETFGWNIFRKKASVKTSSHEDLNIPLDHNLFVEYDGRTHNFLSVSNTGGEKIVFLSFRDKHNFGWYLIAINSVSKGEMWKQEQPAGGYFSDGCSYPAISDDSKYVSVVCATFDHQNTTLSIYDAKTGNVSSFEYIQDSFCEHHFLKENNRIVLICKDFVYVYDMTEKKVVMERPTPCSNNSPPVLDSNDNIYFFGELDHDWSTWVAVKYSLKV